MHYSTNTLKTQGFFVFFMFFYFQVIFLQSVYANCQFAAEMLLFSQPTTLLFRVKYTVTPPLPRHCETSLQTGCGNPSLPLGRERPSKVAAAACMCPAAVPDIIVGNEAPSSAVDRCHSLRSLYLPPAALPSLPRWRFVCIFALP